MIQYSSLGHGNQIYLSDLVVAKFKTKKIYNILYCAQAFSRFSPMQVSPGLICPLAEPSKTRRRALVGQNALLGPKLER
jgi:hypothetical protein